MTISIKLFATLRKYLPGNAVNKTATLNLKDGADTDDIVRVLEIPDGLVHLILIDGKHAVKGTSLHDGAVVSLFPAIAGGL